MLLKMLLKEVTPVRQLAGEAPRRWFSADDMDLVVWYADDGAPNAFQLCYDKTRNERAITWREGVAGLDHRGVDDGEHGGMRHKATPILVADGLLDAPAIRTAFLAASAALPADIVRLVLDKLAIVERGG